MLRDNKTRLRNTATFTSTHQPTNQRETENKTKML